MKALYVASDRLLIHLRGAILVCMYGYNTCELTYAAFSPTDAGSLSEFIYHCMVKGYLYLSKWAPICMAIFIVASSTLCNINYPLGWAFYSDRQIACDGRA